MLGLRPRWLAPLVRRILAPFLAADATQPGRELLLSSLPVGPASVARRLARDWMPFGHDEPIQGMLRSALGEG